MTRVRAALAHLLESCSRALATAYVHVADDSEPFDVPQGPASDSLDDAPAPEPVQIPVFVDARGTCARVIKALKDEADTVEERWWVGMAVALRERDGVVRDHDGDEINISFGEGPEEFRS